MWNKWSWNAMLVSNWCNGFEKPVWQYLIKLNSLILWFTSEYILKRNGCLCLSIDIYKNIHNNQKLEATQVSISSWMLSVLWVLSEWWVPKSCVLLHSVLRWKYAEEVQLDPLGIAEPGKRVGKPSTLFLWFYMNQIMNSKSHCGKVIRVRARGGGPNRWWKQCYLGWLGAILVINYTIYLAAMAENLAENQWHRSLKTTHPSNFFKAIASIVLPSSLMTT